MNYILSAKIKSLSILFLLLMVCPVYAQKVVNYAEQFPDYETDLGRGIGFTLAKDCSASLATIEDIKANQPYYIPNVKLTHVTFTVDEYYRFTDDKTEGKPKFDLTYRQRFPNEELASDPYRWFLLVDMIKGSKAMVLYCQDGKKGGTFVTTDVKYFDQIKRAINLTEQFRNDYSKIVDYFDNDFKSDDELVKAATVSFLLSNSLHYNDVIPYIFVNILEETPLSKQTERHLVKSSIASILSWKEGKKIPHLRAKAFTKLVQIANEKGENAEDATEILTRIDVDELRPYIKSGKAGNIRVNLQAIIRNRVGIHGELLMKLLSEK